MIVNSGFPSTIINLTRENVNGRTITTMVDREGPITIIFDDVVGCDLSHGNVPLAKIMN